MKRGDFTITDSGLAFGLTLPERPVLEAGSRARFAYAGRRAYLAGGSDENTIHTWVHPGFEVHLTVTPDAAEVVQLRTGLRRVLNNDVLEQSIVPLDLPLLLWQWSAGETGATISIDAVITTRGDSRFEWNHTSRTLQLRGDNQQTLLFGFNRDVEWDIRQNPESADHHMRIRMNATGDVQGDLVFAIAGGNDAAELARTLERLQKVQSLVSARRTAALQQDTRQLAIETPDAEVNAVLRWSAHMAGNTSIDLLDGGRSAIPGYDAAAVALTLLALGNTISARGILQHLGSSGLPTNQLPLYLLLAARYSAWTADFDFMYGEWPHVLAATDRAITGGLTDDALIRSAFRELADTAASLGDDTARARFGTEAARTPIPSDHTVVAPELVGIAGDRSATRLASFRRTIDQGSPYAIAAFIYGLLGIEPDAPKNRVRIRPAFPSEWASLELTNLHLGDARIDLRYTRSAHRHTFRLRQTSGAIPVRGVFEALIPANSIDQILLDDKPAQLNMIRSAEGLMMPVQLDLDYERVLEITAGT